MNGPNPHYDRIGAELKYLGTVVEKIKLLKTQAGSGIPRDITNAYEQLSRRLDEAADKLEALESAGPGVADDLARTLDDLVAELKATADLVLDRISAKTAAC
jgi:hypothetical protein